MRIGHRDVMVFHDVLSFLRYLMDGCLTERIKRKQMASVKNTILVLAVLWPVFFWQQSVAGAIQEQSIGADAAEVVYSGQEQLHFSISWSGGVKIGDLWLDLENTDDGRQRILAKVRDYGLFRLFYPVDDRFVTLIDKISLLPLRYEVDQVEGHAYHHTRRLSIYDQNRFAATYQKNDGPMENIAMGGPAHNEFSSFYFTRILSLDGRAKPVVPTFVDRKRHLVAVDLAGKKTMKNTIFGQVTVLGVRPKMEFKGLYDKDGDTTFWLTDDTCRVPMQIRSKILIGSLVAELVDYANPACSQWHNWKELQKERKKNRPPLGVGD